MYLLGEYLMNVSSAEQFDKNPLLPPAIKMKVTTFLIF